MTLKIRKAVKADVNALEEVIDSSELFPSELLETMMEDYLENEASQDIWLTMEDNGKPIVVAYTSPEQMTEGTCTLQLIAVRKDYQGKGVGRQMMKYVENMLREQGQRVLIVETSGLPHFALTREFYIKCNYSKEAVIRDFYEEGDDKVIFWKKLK